MKFIFLMTFFYTVIHLIRYSYKKGENYRYKMEVDYKPVIEAAFLSKWKMKYFTVKVGLLSMFRKKYKLMKIELDKPYNEPFSIEFIDEMVEERFVKDVFEEIKQIYDHKEQKEYDIFPFDDHFQISRRVQFIKVLEEVANNQMNSLLAILYKQFQDGKMKEVEIEEWKPRFIQAGFMDSEEKPKKVDFVSEAIGQEQVHKDVTVVLRDVTKKRVARF